MCCPPYCGVGLAVGEALALGEALPPDVNRPSEPRYAWRLELEELEKLEKLGAALAEVSGEEDVWAAAVSESPRARAEAAISMRRGSGQVRSQFATISEPL